MMPRPRSSLPFDRRLHICIDVFMYLYVCVRAYMHEYTHACIHTHTHTHTCMLTHIHAYMHIYTHKHGCIQVRPGVYSESACKPNFLQVKGPSVRIGADVSQPLGCLI